MTPDEPADLSAPTGEACLAAVGMILDAMSDRGLRSVTISALLSHPASTSTGCRAPA